MSKYLLDTHILLWALGTSKAAQGKFTERATSIIDNPAFPKYFSAVNIWEVAVKFSLNKPDFLISPAEVLKSARDSGYLELSISSEHTAEVGLLPYLGGHKDPFDRLLVAQAKVEAMTLMTVDPLIIALSASPYAVSILDVS